ncbi:MAG: hypothetical protein WBL88_12255 [Nitrososphaeraceae archaeon]
MTQKISTDDLTHVISIPSTITRKHRHESALMTAAHILVCLTQDGKNIEEVASEDFDNNLELVTVWIDYMAGINWMYKDGGEKWITTDNGKKWVEKYYNIRDADYNIIMITPDNCFGTK